MQTQNQSTQQDFSHWIKDFEQHKVELDQQMQQFTALQQEIEGIVEEAPSSAQAAQRLQRLQQLQQSEAYIQLRDQTLSKLQQLETQFSQLSQQCAAPATQPSASARNQAVGEADNRAENRPAKPLARPFI